MTPTKYLNYEQTVEYLIPTFKDWPREHLEGFLLAAQHDGILVDITYCDIEILKKRCAVAFAKKAFKILEENML